MTESTDARRDFSANQLAWLCLMLGFASWCIVLVYHNVANGDLWAKLALGAWLWEQEQMPWQDVFAFTPVLPRYIDHEWGAGFIFYLILKWLGPEGLLLLKVVMACGTLAVAIRVARCQWTPWISILLFAVPAAVCILPAFGVVLRSHCFTYLFFAMTLWWLEGMPQKPLWRGLGIVCLMAIWANVHGGFVAGLGAVGVYAACSVLQQKRWLRPALLVLSSGTVTFLTPYGYHFWTYLVPALLHPRPHIEEWQPMVLWTWDMFVGFRILFVATALVVALGWRNTQRKSWPGLALTILTAYLALRSRRHAPFLGICALMFASAYLPGAAQTLAGWLRMLWPKRRPLAEGTETIGAIRPARSMLAMAGLYALLTLAVVQRFLPACTFLVIAPAGQYPVREVDILELAAARGNAALPFEWGSYVSWRLYPHVKVSCDGRYEAAYPESTFLMNLAFFDKSGGGWDRLVRDHKVDFILLDLANCRLTPADLTARGYCLIWEDPRVSALWALEKHTAGLAEAVRGLPPTTIDPLDARIPCRWFAKAERLAAR